MQPIVDLRLGDVYRPRSSSHLIYADSRHDPGLRSSLRWSRPAGGVAGVESHRVFGAVSHLRRILIRDQANRDAIAMQLLGTRNHPARAWADIVDLLTLHPDSRRWVVRLLGEIDAA